MIKLALTLIAFLILMTDFSQSEKDKIFFNNVANYSRRMEFVNDTYLHSHTDTTTGFIYVDEEAMSLKITNKYSPEKLDIPGIREENGWYFGANFKAHLGHNGFEVYYTFTEADHYTYLMVYFYKPRD